MRIVSENPFANVKGVAGGISARRVLQVTALVTLKLHNYWRSVTLFNADNQTPESVLTGCAHKRTTNKTAKKALDDIFSMSNTDVLSFETRRTLYSCLRRWIRGVIFRRETCFIQLHQRVAKFRTLKGQTRQGINRAGCDSPLSVIRDAQLLALPLPYRRPSCAVPLGTE